MNEEERRGCVMQKELQQKEDQDNRKCNERKRLQDEERSNA
jgi:hypothetical protein